MNSARVSTCLWFDGDGEKAAELYTSLIPNSEIGKVLRTEPEGPAFLIEFTVGGAPFQALNGGPQYQHTEAASISVPTADQPETDRLWSALCAEGGSEGQCGWLKDRFGVSWQIVPEVLPGLLCADDRAAAGRVLQAMLTMKKIDIAKLEQAFSSPPE